jgi:hypothetical protein
LLGLDTPDDTAFDHNSGETVEFRDNDDVQRIAVLSFGIGDEPEVVGENHTRRQDLFELEEMGFRVIIIFLGAALRGLDDYIYATHNLFF